MQEGSARRAELLERAYGYMLDHSLSKFSLRPLAAGIGSSPRVLLYLFGSKDGLITELLARSRVDELAALRRAEAGEPGLSLGAAVRLIWDWLSATRRRPVLMLWLEAYAQSLADPDGPWGGFARQTVEGWLQFLAATQPPSRRRSAMGAAERTAALAILRGALLDLLATGDVDRTRAAVSLQAGRLDSN